MSWSEATELLNCRTIKIKKERACKQDIYCYFFFIFSLFIFEHAFASFKISEREENGMIVVSADAEFW
jgi:hypothetical protein